MTIRVKKDRIEFVSKEGTLYTLRETGDGFSFNGTIEGSRVFPLNDLINVLATATHFQGTVAGFTAGGDNRPTVQAHSNTIDKFPFATDVNATDHSDIMQRIHRLAGCSSSSNGYTVGGSDFIHTPGSGQLNVMNKFPFASTTNATSPGTLTGGTNGPGSQSSTTHGYCLNNGRIDKFPFSSDTNATNIGTSSGIHNCGQSSATHGYSAGAWPGSGGTVPTDIQKFPFSSDTNASVVGSLIRGGGTAQGMASSVAGYVAGRTADSLPIEKFSFSSDSNSIDVGELQVRRTSVTGISGVFSGYATGGGLPGITRIDKFPFATNNNASFVSYLFEGRSWAAGCQD